VWTEFLPQLLQTLFIDFTSFAVENITFDVLKLAVNRRTQNFSRPFAVLSSRLKTSFY
jgi:hypothetical protein